MTDFGTILLGIVQGLTEFLPVSSSGHLVLFEHFLGFKEPELLLDTSLHMGTLMAVCIFFGDDLKKMCQETWAVITRKEGMSFKCNRHASVTLMVIIGSLPTALMGFIFKDWIEPFFSSVIIAGAMLLCTGGIVGITRLIPRSHNTRNQVTPLMALAVGTAQGLAIMPGISRSGATIVCALLLGLNRDMAGRFSFLLSIPAIVGAVALQLNAEALGRVGAVPLLLGFITSALVGLLALRILMGMIRAGHLYYFAPYCWMAGLAIILFV
ncbi:MAG: undecaprenyl-diphosphate phosphatase [Deltaproteobacteria bacterium]|jgi:undecaprenyl-diphosphatase